ncbi:MAG: MBL fold metallo-hydrolase, partial [Candidatus Sumerlaeota bacterium]|nr:MBL fold metallo-hydrolase [Candidatus Sumerlaeota bacterium]
MIFQHFLLDSNESNLYVIACEETREAALIDAGAFDPRVVDFVRERGLRVKAVLVTHGHWDHTGGLDRYLRAFGCRALGSPDVRDGQVIEIGRLTIRALTTT